MNWDKSVCNYLDTVLNTTDIALIYIIHKGNQPNDNLITIDEEMVFNTSLKGWSFNVDSNIVLILSKELCNVQ